MKILILGSGGREHALAWRMSQDDGVEEIYVMPGNAGMVGAKIKPILRNRTLSETREFCQKNQVAFVVVGPEKYLFEGWVDEFTQWGIPTVGPTKAAAKLEEFKTFSKNFMSDNKIPTARFFNVKTEAEALRAVDQAQGWAGIVVKLSGPALGKGVVVTETAAEAREVIQKFYADSSPGIEGGMVIEEKLAGREVSLFYACLDQEYRLIATACDHKRLLDGDQGPNTGGMGAISPAPWIDAEFLARAEEKIVKPTLSGMKKVGAPYRGILFIGLLGDSLLEYNVRFGDPETQTFLPLIEGHFTKFLYALARGDREEFNRIPLQTATAHSIHVVKAARGYPGVFGEVVESGKKIVPKTPKAKEGQHWFFAGVKQEQSDLVSSGGRVLGLTAWATNPAEARSKVYQELSAVKFEGEQFRTDIGGQK